MTVRQILTAGVLTAGVAHAGVAHAGAGPVDPGQMPTSSVVILSGQQTSPSSVSGAFNIEAKDGSKASSAFSAENASVNLFMMTGGKNGTEINFSTFSNSDSMNVIYDPRVLIMPDGEGITLPDPSGNGKG